MGKFDLKRRRSQLKVPMQNRYKIGMQIVSFLSPRSQRACYRLFARKRAKTSYHLRRVATESAAFVARSEVLVYRLTPDYPNSGNPWPKFPLRPTLFCSQSPQLGKSHHRAPPVPSGRRSAYKFARAKSRLNQRRLQGAATKRGTCLLFASFIALSNAFFDWIRLSLALVARAWLVLEAVCTL